MTIDVTPHPSMNSCLYCTSALQVLISNLNPTMLVPLISSHFSAFTFLLLLLFSAAALPHSSAAAPAHTLKLPLVHRAPYPPPPSEALAADIHRLSTFSSAIRGRRTHPQLPVNSAAASGSGQYLVTLHLGTPPQPVFLVADTGSDLTWVSCSACRSNCSSRATTFFPRHSATFSPYHCYESSCRLVPPPQKPPRCHHKPLHSTCRYEYSYGDGSVTGGIFSQETTAFNTSAGKLVKFQHLSFGCAFWNYGPSITGRSFKGADGVLGLGRGPISFPTQLGRFFGRKFSYCLMDYGLSPTPTSYLLIGGGSANGSAGAKSRLSYTPILNNPFSPTFYYIGIASVSVNNAKLPINPSVWAMDEYGNGGTVVDSGTTLSFLPEPAYRVLVAVFERLVKLPKVADPRSELDLCLNVSGITRPSFPRLSFKLGGGSVFSPPPRNYFIDAYEDVKCLAFQPVTSINGFSVFGNILQQGYTFEFDKERSRLGFTRHGCAVP